MNWILMLLGIFFFAEGLFFEIQSLKPDKGFRYISFEEGYNIVLCPPAEGQRFTDKDGKDVTKEISFLVFRKMKSNPS